MVLLVGIVGMTAYWGLAGSSRSDAQAQYFPDAAGVSAPADPLPPEPGAQPCTAVPVLASSENAPLISALAEAYQGGRRNIAGHCVSLTVSAARSGSAATDVAGGFARTSTGARPVIWAPDSSAWVDLARRSGAQPVVLPERVPPIAHTPIVIAMPRSRATALGWPDLHPTWRDYLGAGADETFWARHGHPEWGPFRIGRTSPQLASSGLYGLLAEYAAIAGHPGMLRAEETSDPRLIERVRRAELATVYYAPSDDHLAWHNRRAQDSGDVPGLISALTTSEKALWDYDRGVISKDGVTQQRITPAADPLVPVYPRDGTFFVDCPLAVLAGSWVEDHQRAAAADFVRFAQTPQGQAVVRANGYRDVLGRTDPPVAETASYGNLTWLPAFPAPAPEELTAIQERFIQVRKRARVLFLLDASSSMNDPIANGQTRLRVAEDAIIAALPHFAPDDQVGLAAFSADPHSTDIKPGLLSQVGPIGGKHSDLVAQLHNVETHARTPLYDAVIKSTELMAGPGYDPNQINAVVLVTDSHNDTADPTLERMSALLTELARHDRGVMVFTLACAERADKPVLELITKLTRAQYYDSTDPMRVSQVLHELVSSL